MLTESPGSPLRINPAATVLRNFAVGFNDLIWSLQASERGSGAGVIEHAFCHRVTLIRAWDWHNCLRLWR
jgi:hypothetical protein